jgi:hypothetical protein
LAAALGAGALAGATWYAVVVAIRSQATYLFIGVSFCIALAAVRGAGRPGADIAVIVVAVVLLALVVCFYYVDRFGILRTAQANNVSLNVPLNPSFGWLKLVLREGFKRTPSQYVYCVIALGSSATYAVRGHRP